jgi:acetylornithine deacetylase/succinyl-diaminopimelate desuccinylase-like protein
VDRIVSGGVGSRRYRVTFRGPGGHSYAAFGLVNPMYAMAECARGLAAVEVPSSPPTTHCVSVVSGGTSINAIANAVTIEVDLRSASAAELDRLDKRFLQIVDEAVATENAARSTSAGPITAELARVGDRPAGETPAGTPIRDFAAAAVSAEGYAPRFEFSSTDANVPMSLGIPALKVGAGGRGGRAHSLEEWLDVEPQECLRGMRTSLATILALAGMEGIG